MVNLVGIFVFHHGGSGKWIDQEDSGHTHISQLSVD